MKNRHEDNRSDKDVTRRTPSDQSSRDRSLERDSDLGGDRSYRGSDIDRPRDESLGSDLDREPGRTSGGDFDRLTDRDLGRTSGSDRFSGSTSGIDEDVERDSPSSRRSGGMKDEM